MVCPAGPSDQCSTKRKLQTRWKLRLGPMISLVSVLLSMDRCISFFIEPQVAFSHGRIRQRFSFARHPLTLTSKDDEQEEPGTNGDEDYDDDFSAWLVTNLKQWPLLPTSPTSDPTISMAPILLDEPPPIDDERMYREAESWNKTNSVSLAEDESSFLKRPLSRVFTIDSLLQLTVSSATMSSSIAAAAASAVINKVNWTALEELGSLDKFVGGVVQSTGKSAEVLLKQASTRMEALVAEASSAVSPEMIEALIRKSSETVYNVTKSNGKYNASISSLGGVGAVAPSDRLSTTSGGPFSPESTTYAMSLLRTADGLFRKGYVAGDPISVKAQQAKPSIVKNVPVIAGSRALFDAFDSAYELNVWTPTMAKAAEMGALSGAIYEDTLPRSRALGQTIVARGTTVDVAWMVTDAIANRTSFRDARDGDDMAGMAQPFLVRTITIRGFDASDESVDRELLLNRICTATPVPLSNSKAPGIFVHSGLLEIARAIYQDIKPFIDWTAPTHKLVLNGHSIGGSVSLLLLFLMIKDYGADFVKKNVVKVYTFGCPPVAVMKDSNGDILSALELPASLVQGFIQPWDPIVRLFSRIDALYPLVGDLGPDNSTPFADGPPRTLRPLLKAVIESWDGWPRFRDNFKGTANQTYTSVGVQHLLLPDPTRYLADRFVAMNIPVPPVETVLRISNKELYPALSSVFPLDVFEVSFVPQAIRSFVHHFYPAYGSPMVDYAKDLQRKARGTASSDRQGDGRVVTEEDLVVASELATSSTVDGANGIDWGKATQWLVRNNVKP